jgi:anti-sigma factor RsiW
VVCELKNTHLHAYFDGELDAAGSAAFEGHLASCPECAAALRAEEQLRDALAGAQLFERPSASFRTKVLAALPAQSSRPTQRSSQLFRWAALAAALLLAAFLGREVLRAVQARTGEMAIASSSIDAHIRSLQPGHLLDVPSTDQHTVKPWFDGKINFAPTVRDFSADGFPLLGGRLDAISGQTAAVLVYGRRKHIVNVFVLDSQALPMADSGEQHGYGWVSWKQDNFTYIAVSDVAAADLEQLRDLFQKQ